MGNPDDCPENPLQDTEREYHNVEEHQEEEHPDNFAISIPPQPFFVPGYTGSTPGAGPQRQFVIGDPYGRYTHELLQDHRVAGSRLDPINTDKEFVRFAPRDPREGMDNPHKPMDPYFIPGYSGFTPGVGSRRYNSVGETYARMTHTNLVKHPVAGKRLIPILEESPELIAKEEEVKFYCNKHELTAKDLIRRFGMSPGYTGHVPRAVFRHGKSSAKIFNDSIAEFEEIMERKH